MKPIDDHHADEDADRLQQQQRVSRFFCWILVVAILGLAFILLKILNRLLEQIPTSP